MTKQRTLVATVNVLIMMALVTGPDPRKVDTSGVNYATLASVAEVAASKTSGATRLHQEWRLRVL